MARLVRHTRLWALDTGVLGYGAIGAGLYGILGLFLAPLAPLVGLRPAFALVPFFGFSFGPIVGFVVGFAGQVISGLISGATITDSILPGLGSGVAGLVAGLAPLYLARFTTGSLRRRALGGAIAGIVGSAAGSLVALGGVLGGGALGTILWDEVVPLFIGNGLVSLVLVPILVYAWDPLSESMAS